MVNNNFMMMPAVSMVKKNVSDQSLICGKTFYLLKIGHCLAGNIFVTEPAKTGLICIKCTYLFFCVCYTISASFIEFLRKFCVYDEIFDEVLC